MRRIRSLSFKTENKIEILGGCSKLVIIALTANYRSSNNLNVYICVSVYTYIYI